MGLIIAGLLLYYYRLIPFLDFVELKTIDIRFLSRGEQAPGSQVAIAVIDEKSLAAEGKWPWSRLKMAGLINKLSDAGASVIALDVGFFEPDRQDAVAVINEIRQNKDLLAVNTEALTTFLDEEEGKRNYDKRLADDIKQSKAKVVLGYYFNQDIMIPTGTDKDAFTNHTRNIRSSKYMFDRYIPVNPNKLKPDTIPFKEYGFPESNIRIISDSTKYSGFFNAEPDIDGNLRWIPAVMGFDGKRYAPLSLMALCAYFETHASVVWTDYGVREIKLGDIEIPVSSDGKIMINFRGGQGTFPYYAITDILNDKIPKDRLKGKIIVVGASAIGLHDIKTTPFDRMPGPEIHATLIDNILSGTFLYYPSGYELFSCLAIIAAGLLMGLVLSFVGSTAGLAVFLIFFSGYWFIARTLFNEMGLILNLVYPLFVLSCTYIAIAGYQYFAVEGKRRFIQSAFSTYLAPTVVDELIKSPEKLNLGGEQINITAFFSDVKGFSTISEKLSPGELVELLNEYLTEMEEIIQTHLGIVDKYEGDAIIAIFGAPLKVPNHAENACLASIDMQDRLAQLREKWRAVNKPALEMRIGIATGLAIVGNMGSKKRMDYTMMGDTVNTAARLEGVNKVYGTYSMISDTTYAAAKDKIAAREIDAVNVVGKKRPVTIYQVMGRKTASGSHVDEIIRQYEIALSAYREMDWEKATRLFKDVLKLDPEDGPSQVMIERCLLYQKTPPPTDWNRAFSMVSK